MAAPHLKAVPPMEDDQDTAGVTGEDQAAGAEAGPLHETPVTDAAAVSYKALLIATRERVALAVDDPRTPARDLAALTKRLMDTAREITDIELREHEAAEQERKKQERAATDAEAFDPEAI